MSTAHFHPIIRTWFERRFEGPTEAQAQGWPAIAQGRHTLIAAPTGSGKTLAAFLNCLDDLVRQGLDGGLPDLTQVVYVSPLKALSNDVERNLQEPLAEITALAEELGTPIPEVRVAVRTGDTPARQRAQNAKHPPHILITTPESLFILLTSESGRRALRGVRTLILDELHALVGNKRGSHLSLSAERLSRGSEHPVTRIGLSATQRPIEEVARFLTGGAHGAGGSSRARLEAPRRGLDDATSSPASRDPASLAPWAHCAIVDTGHRREMDIAVELPKDHELGPIASHELWAQVLDQIAGHVRAHHTTLVFVNTRRLVERVAHQLSERLGGEHVVAHHGSLSRETRFEAEQRLKAGDVKVCVATASLELGIDIGDVDLVCQIGSPRSIAVALQRVGRSGHSLKGMPKGWLYPLTRDELVETAALLRAANDGTLDTLRIPAWPLDILAQQIVATTVGEDWWAEDDLFTFVRGAYPYRDLPREQFDQVLTMLTDGVAGRWGRNGAYLYHDSVNHRVKARRGGRIATVTSGGAIPDTADYLVLTEPEGTLVGTVNEDFAVESMAGDVFLLGNTPWKIRRVESGVMRVEEAHGQSPTIPFWLGEAPGRTTELSAEVSVLRQGVDERLPVPEAAVAWLVEGGLPEDAAQQVVDYVTEGKRVLGMVPTAERIIAERFFDDAGGMQLVIHSPWGSRINRAWGLALRKRFCRAFDFELQAAATDDGINISLGPQHSFPLEEVFHYLKSNTAEDVLLQAVYQSPLFGTRWRWNASRALALLRTVGGKRVPTPIQRMRSDDLLAAVFPAQAACQDNLAAGTDIETPDHPLVFETVRDCLTEALDAEGMKGLLAKIERGEIEVFAKDTVQPSVFSHQVLNAMPYAFLDDAPLEERRARAVSLRRALPEDSRELGALDSDAIAEQSANAWPPVRDADELHDALLSLGLLSEADILRHEANPDALNTYREWYAELAEAGRVLTLRAGGMSFWLAAERAGLAAALYPDGELFAGPITSPTKPALPKGEALDPDEPLVDLVRGRAESAGPFTVAEMAETLALRESSIAIATARLEAEGLLLRGFYRMPEGRLSEAGASPEQSVEEFCDRRILARIHRSTINRLRREIEPVPAASFIRFLLEWQQATPGSRAAGESGLAGVIERLQGFEAAAAEWERSILPARVSGYSSNMLDTLCFSGEAVWGRFARRAPAATPPAGLSRNGPISLALREDVSWLLDPPAEADGPKPVLSGAAVDVLEYLTEHGASFLPDIVGGTRRLPSEVGDGMWQLVAAGMVTADGFSALRGLVTGAAKRAARRSRFNRGPRMRTASSRWEVLRPEAPASADDVIDARAAQLLRRYGVMTRELLAREPMAPPWRLLLRAYRRAEARGEVRGGRFLAGFVGEQFALPAAVDAVRAVHRRAPAGDVVRLSACDPLNLVGILTPGARIPAVTGNEVIYRDGVPLETAPAADVGAA